MKLGTHHNNCERFSRNEQPISLMINDYWTSIYKTTCFRSLCDNSFPYCNQYCIYIVMAFWIVYEHNIIKSSPKGNNSY